jgi:hypothetical protein
VSSAELLESTVIMFHLILRLSCQCLEDQLYLLLVHNKRKHTEVVIINAHREKCNATIKEASSRNKEDVEGTLTYHHPRLPREEQFHPN